jgi:hypothetical protein
MFKLDGLQPIWDNTVIDTDKTTADYNIGEPILREMCFSPDKPWEIDFHYSNVLKDGDVYRMYYLTHINYEDKCPKYTFTEEEVLANKWLLYYANMFICYAESKDGIHWERPNLGICEYKGSKENNIILRSEDLPGRFSIWDNFFVFKDTNPSCPPDEIYKGIGFDTKTLDEDVKSSFREALSYYASADGIHFRFVRTLRIAEGTYDTLNTCTYDEKSGKYVLYYRGWHNIPASGGRINGTRDIRRAESTDFINWTGFEQIEFDDDFDYPLYTNNIMRYYRNPNILLGFPTRYIERKEWTYNYEQLPWREERLNKIRTAHPREGFALTDNVFMCSRDGKRWCRSNEAFFTPGVEKDRNWVYGDCYLSYMMIETPTEDGKAKEISLFVPQPNRGETKTPENAEKLYRYTIRRDGFAYYKAKSCGAVVVTKPLVFEGSKLQINFSTSAFGNIYITMRDKDGNTAKTCELFGNSDHRSVRFENAEISDFAGKEVTLTFEMKDAKLYAFEFLE